MSFANEFIKNRPANLFAPPQAISGRFDIMECLSENELGETFLLTEKSGGPQGRGKFVLKCYRKSVIETKESEILQELEHKGLPKFEMEVDDEEIFYVLREYAEGITLNQYLEENGIMEEATALRIAVQLCDVLDYLHTRPVPIIHRDIKPSNIIINQKETGVKLIDFGISRKFAEDSDTDTKYYGTKKFSPPEQYGFSQTDCRTDIFALGVVLRLMLTGSVNGKTGDGGLKRIIEKCTAFSPKERYQSAGALKNALIRHKNRTKKKAAGAAILVLTLLIGLGAGFLVGRYTEFLPPTGESAAYEIYTFYEPLIEEAVRLMLGKENGETVLFGELDNITELHIIGNSVFGTYDEFTSNRGPINSFGPISRLDDLASMKNLRLLNIIGNTISDLSPLTECKLLERIIFAGNTISDVSPLTELPRLHILDLHYTGINNFSYFEEMSHLHFLGISRTPLYSIRELNAPHVRHLDISHTHVTELYGVEKFALVNRLDIADTGIHDFSPLNGLPMLNELTISRNMEKFLDTLNRDDIQIFFRD